MEQVSASRKGGKSSEVKFWALIMVWERESVTRMAKNEENFIALHDGDFSSFS